MREITTKVYEYSELSDKAKDKARDWYLECGLDHEWWEAVYKDAENIGLRITGFDLGRSQTCDGYFITGTKACAEKILKDHGKVCETYTTAENFLKERATFWSDEDDGEGTYENEERLDELEKEFLRSLLEDYRINLEQEYECLTSKESVEEDILANGYGFTEEGERP